MIPLIINKKLYDCPESWADVPLSKLVALNNLCLELPENIRSSFVISGSELSPFSDADRVVLFGLKQSVVALLCNISDDIIGSVAKKDIHSLFDNTLITYVVSVTDQYVGYEYSGDEYFDWKGERYYYPVSGTDILGKVMPMAALEAMQFAQLSDLALLADKISSGDYSLCGVMVAIACLKQDETYSSEVATKRSVLFSDIPMSVVLDVFFCLQQLMIISELNILIATTEGKSV